MANDGFVRISEVLSGTTGMHFPFEEMVAESACGARGRGETPMNMHDGPPRAGNFTAASVAAFP